MTGFTVLNFKIIVLYYAHKFPADSQSTCVAKPHEVINSCGDSGILQEGGCDVTICSAFTSSYLYPLIASDTFLTDAGY